jgi:uroporphyrinogen decarboxylase
MTKKGLFLANARGEYTDRTPIWIMRQAGRYLPAYRKVKEKYTFEELCRTPAAAAEVTAQPVEILGVDAAIIFSDILLILEPLGVNLKFSPGPVISPILERSEQVVGYHYFDAEKHLGFVAEALIETRKRIGPDIPLLGFCGAPFTLFCYLCGIHGARDFHKAMKFALNHLDETSRLLDLLTSVSLEYLRMQIRAGADAVQIFDTWAGELAADEFCRWSLPYIRAIADELSSDGAVTSLYIKGTNHLLEHLVRMNVDIIGVDWRTPLPEAARKLAPKTVQGNLDPHLLLGPRDIVIEKARKMLEEMAGYPGYIFNLGHGILPDTPVENVRALVETVHSFERKKDE